MLRVLAVMALRSLLAHKVKTLIVGTLMAFGTFIFVVGTALLDTVESTMTASITSSIAGHLQIYDARAKDDLALFGSGFMSADDIGHIDDFGAVERALAGVQGIAAVVPMGLGISMSSSPSELDRTLTALRRSPADPVLKARVRGIAEQLRKDLELRRALAADQAELQRQIEVVDRAVSDALWADYDADPASLIEWLDTTLAPVGGDGWLYYVRYLGTDPAQFAARFDRFEIVEGQAIPAGKRGFLFNQHTYERWIKHPVARELDDVHEAVTVRAQRIADDPILREKIARNSRQFRRVVEQLEPDDARALERELRAYLADASADLASLVQAFLEGIDDANVADRHAWFYAHVAPRIRLHEFAPGDVMTLRAFTKSGYMRAVNVPIYGVFRFKGMEDSDLAGAFNVVDLISFRDLFGLMTAERRAELDEIRAGVGVRDVKAEDADDALFGEASDLVASAGVQAFEPLADGALSVAAGRAPAPADHTAEELRSGVALNAAVILRDDDDLWPAKARIEAALKAAGLNLRVVDWRTASGMVGQYIVAMRAVLYVAILIIFGVAVIIINNSMVMATLERVREIGALRAIGAGRGFILRMFCVETLTLGLLAGGAGALLGALFVGALGVRGIPAPHDVLAFLFGGPRLYPSVGAVHLVLGLVAVIVVSLASTLYPARIAARVQPIVAMSPRE